MRNKKYIYIGIGVAIIAIIIPLSIIGLESEPEVESMEELDFTYEVANAQLQQNLATHGISMSSPITLINQNKINEFCTFFSEVLKQREVEFCTSTELLDSEGNFLGNIHMIGNRNMPKMVLAVAQTNPFMDNLDQIKLVFEESVDVVVCDCWEEYMPGGIPTVSQWVDDQRDFHSTDTRPTSASSLDLEEKIIQMELTTNNEGYLWKLLISG